ncbi:MAG: hypothetical protein HND56_00005 [Pseudomonadota bacterium]|nr:MAG: hypothetical protein HND56_00005 [Pseudomonadota bacterium]
MCWSERRRHFRLYTPKPKPEVAVTHHGMNTAEVAGTVLVHRDDTVYTIAKNYNLEPSNRLRKTASNEPYTLVSGQRLSLPQPRDYRVYANGMRSEYRTNVPC